MFLNKIYFYILLFNLCILGNQSNCKNDFETNYPVQISPSGWNYSPTISPNHQYISFLHADNMSDVVASGKIWLYKIGEKNMGKLCDLKLFYYLDGFPIWSNDSQILYFSSGGIIYKLNISTMKVDSLFWTDQKNVSFLAPSLSKDNKKLAFWSFSKFDKTVSHSVWVLDLTNGDVKKFPEIEYGAVTEVKFSRPQWCKNDSNIIAAFFPLGEYSDQTDLYLLNLENYNQNKIFSSITSSHFKIIKDYIYFSTYFNQKLFLCSYNLSNSSINKILAIDNSQFDICIINDSIKIFFDRKENMVVYNNNKIKELNLKGVNPKYSDPYLIFERHKKNGNKDENRLFYIKNINP
jgi:hypothetical protein